MELPSAELPLFVFPHGGLQLLECKKRAFPLPIFFTFIFTDAKGDHYYAACLQFYELLSESELIATCKQVFRVQQSEPDSDNEYMATESEEKQNSSDQPVSIEKQPQATNK